MDTDTALGRAVGRTARRIAGRHPGVVVGTVDLGSGSTAIVAAGRTSLPDGPEPDGRTLFEIGSITKVFTALLLADAVTRGEVALDTPLRALLPGHVAVPSKDGVEITLEHLATHTSGLPRSPLGVTAELRSALFTHDNPYSALTRDGLYDALGRTRLRRTPGTGRIAYSNSGAALLGHALVAAAGSRYADGPDAGSQGYATLVRERICTPLGLGDTVVSLDAAQSRRLAVGHRRRDRPTPHWELPGLAGAGALRSTASDVLAFLRAQLVPPAGPLGAAIALTQVPRRTRGRTGIGLGWMLADGRTGRSLWHNGGTGGFRSFAAFTPDQGTAVVILVNNHRGPDLAGIRLLDDARDD